MEPGKHEAIDIADGDPQGRSTPDHIELMPKDKDFDFNAGRDRNSPTTAHPEQPEKIGHRNDYQPIPR